MKEIFVEKRFNASSLIIIEQANRIIEHYQAQGYTLTLRQLYYQFVARDLIENSQKEYKRIGSIISSARLAGAIDWEVIEDRTRSLEEVPTWHSPKAILESAAHSFKIDKWDSQPVYMEVWVEKEALAGVIAQACKEYDLPYFSCRGYASQTALYDAGKRIQIHLDYRPVVILHLGDHDPSGIDMTRDIKDRLELFSGYWGGDHDGGSLDIERIALNYDQVEEHKPPPNPVKATDSRTGAYSKKFGDSCWELDALEPSLMEQLINDQVESYLDQDQWDKEKERERELKKRLHTIANEFE